MKSKSLTNNHILHYLPLDATITSSDITELYNLMTKENKLKEVCDLTKIKEREDDGRNYIYINRKQFIGKDYHDLINRLYDYYFGLSTSTLESFFPEWMKWRRDCKQVTPKTIEENFYLWNSLFKNTDIVKKAITRLTTLDFINFFRELTENGSLTRKRFNDGKSILNSMYYHAVELGIVESNPLLNINYRLFKYKPENKEDKVYSIEERALLLEYLNPINDIYSLAIQLDFHLVARIGELQELKWSDIRENKIRIQGQTKKERTMNDDLTFSSRVVNHSDQVKGNTSHGFRTMILNSNALQILARIKDLNPNGKYILMFQDRQISKETFNRRLQKYCKELAIEYKSSHGIRFTVASYLYSQGIKPTTLQKLLGHSTLAMTLHYLRNVTNEDETDQEICSILDVAYTCIQSKKTKKPRNRYNSTDSEFNFGGDTQI